ncbi:hypothetical protein [Streptomyces sp. NPDC060194]|uniref:hypothetical protein n=1 Tax=Streptomyces sp. NPDC060194 TaxID=3347069 RepID=UPI00365E4509
MDNALRITAFTAALAAVFGTAYGVGGAMDPVAADSRAAGEGAHDPASDGHREPDEGGGRAPEGGGRDDAAGGLAVSEGGYTLALDTPRVRAGARSELRFSVLDARGRKVTAYDTEHGKELHFIVASRDLAVYRHLHPSRAADGTWSVRTTLPEAGGYRALADFRPAKAEGVTLGADLAVAGPADPAPLAPASRTAVVDGYRVRLSGTLRPGVEGELGFTVTRAGRPVTDLQPYLGAYGHLVALRSGDLAYLHVHPNGGPGEGTSEPGSEVSFTATAPSTGSYRLFLDFRHEGKVRTAAFTVRADSAADPGAETSPKAPQSDGHAH